MKLFVWQNVLCDYTCRIMFALADSVEEAREQIMAKEGKGGQIEDDLQLEPEVYQKPVGFAVWGGA